MHKMTEENLKAAFAGESQAHMKYLAFADAAEKDYPNIARLFRAVAFAEQAHATKHLKTLGGVGSVVDNLAAAMGGENFEVDEMYPAYQAVAESQGERAALIGMNWALEAEKVHAALYARAKVDAEAGKDAGIGTIYVCSACGHTVEGQAPDKCPLCNAPQSKFRSF